MVTELITKNANVLIRELLWFGEVIDTRMKLYFGKECNYASVFSVIPPVHEEEETPYVRFINYYRLKPEERIVLALALAPHVCPQLLDNFWTKNTTTDRGFTEFGGLKGTTHGGFLPTAETALFLLAGNDLKNRFAFTYLFESNHFFYAHEILKLVPAGNGEPVLSGALQLSREFIDHSIGME
jgi:hypothetical protein